MVITSDIDFPPLILASASPQRKRILTDHGVIFESFPSDIIETIDPELSPQENVIRLAYRKAEAICKAHPERAVLGADTVVVADGRILGKPDNAEASFEMIMRKSGTDEEVVTGFCFLMPRIRIEGAVTSVVSYQTFDESVARNIISSGEWNGVAGALRIEGKAMSRIIAKTEGDIENIIGLPFSDIRFLLQRWIR